MSTSPRPIAQRRPYTLLERAPIAAAQEMGRAGGRDWRRQRWHILDAHGKPLCGRREWWEIVDLDEYAYVTDQRICKPCHGQYSWTPMPLEVERQDRGYGTPCLVWVRGRSTRGYGKRQHAGVSKATHIEAWEAVHGAIPVGYVLHHDCEQKDCLDLGHMRTVTRAEHVRIHRKGKPLIGGQKRG